MSKHIVYYDAPGKYVVAAVQHLSTYTYYKRLAVCESLGEATEVAEKLNAL